MAGAAVLAMSAVRNRFMRRRLLFTLILSIAFFVVHVLRLSAAAVPGLTDVAALETFLASLEHLLAALGAINLLVTLAFNPWFRDGSIERAPSIVQDAIVIAVFGSTAL